MRLTPVVIALLLAASSAAADDGCPLAADVGIGARVRIRTALQVDTVIGEIAGCDRDGVLLATVHGRALTAISHGSIERLSLSGGEQRATGKGALVGAIAVGLVGGVFGAANPFCDEGCSSSAAGRAAGGGLAGAAVGGLLGAAIGSAFTEERWERVDTRAPRVGATISAGRSRLALGLTVRF